jgi:hypothetical protein
VIYAHGRSSLHYVNTISGITTGACVLRLRSQ